MALIRSRHIDAGREPKVAVKCGNVYCFWTCSAAGDEVDNDEERISRQRRSTVPAEIPQSAPVKASSRRSNEAAHVVSEEEPAVPQVAPAAPEVMKEPRGPPTLLGNLADAAKAASIFDGDQVADCNMEQFIEVCEAHLDLLSNLGSGLGMAISDFRGNKDVVVKTYRDSPESRRTCRAYLQVEVQSGKHTVSKTNAYLKSPTGAMQLQWVLRGLDFFFTLLKNVWAGTADPAKVAYAQTLQPFHGFFASTAFSVSMSQMPNNKKQMCARQELAPDVDKSILATTLEADFQRAIDGVLPLVKQMIELMKEAGLWETRKV